MACRSICVHVYPHVGTCVGTHAYAHFCTDIYEYVDTHAYAHVCVHVCTHDYIWFYPHMHISTPISTHTSMPSRSISMHLSVHMFWPHVLPKRCLHKRTFDVQGLCGPPRTELLVPITSPPTQARMRGIRGQARALTHAGREACVHRQAGACTHTGACRHACTEAGAHTRACTVDRSHVWPCLGAPVQDNWGCVHAHAPACIQAPCVLSDRCRGSTNWMLENGAKNCRAKACV